jgi:hypothetical protein
MMLNKFKKKTVSFVYIYKPAVELGATEMVLLQNTAFAAYNISN